MRAFRGKTMRFQLAVALTMLGMWVGGVPAQAGLVLGETITCLNTDLKVVIEREGGLFGTTRLTVKENRIWGRTFYREGYERKMLSTRALPADSELPELVKTALAEHPYSEKLGGHIVLIQSKNLTVVYLVPSEKVERLYGEKVEVYVADHAGQFSTRFDFFEDCQQ
jgi:hypothetical protein